MRETEMFYCYAMNVIANYIRNQEEENADE